jgi:hypothetical protein
MKELEPAPGVVIYFPLATLTQPLDQIDNPESSASRTSAPPTGNRASDAFE